MWGRRARASPGVSNLPDHWAVTKRLVVRLLERGSSTLSRVPFRFAYLKSHAMRRPVPLRYRWPGIPALSVAPGTIADHPPGFLCREASAVIATSSATAADSPAAKDLFPRPSHDMKTPEGTHRRRTGGAVGTSPGQASNRVDTEVVCLVCSSEGGHWSTMSQIEPQYAREEHTSCICARTRSRCSAWRVPQSGVVTFARRFPVRPGRQPGFTVRTPVGEGVLAVLAAPHMR